MKQVLLIIQSKEEGKTDSTLEFLNDYAPYAILLVGDARVCKQATLPVSEEWNAIKGEQNLTAWDKVPNTHFEYTQPCICYWTKEDLDADKGTYQDYLPEEAEDSLYYYDAKMI